MPPFTHIVSANYHDRGGTHTGLPWLSRPVDNEPDTAVGAKALLLTGVEFRGSSSYEQGFGCGLVAYCETLTPLTEARTDGIRLHYDGACFVNEAGRIFNRCDTLILNNDGSMYAIVAETSTKAGIESGQPQEALATA